MTSKDTDSKGRPWIILRITSRGKTIHSVSPYRSHEFIDSIQHRPGTAEWYAEIRNRNLTSRELLYAFNVLGLTKNERLKCVQGYFEINKVLTVLKLGEKAPQLLTPTHVEQWIEFHVTFRRFGGVERALARAKAFWQWMADNGIVEYNPWQGKNIKPEDVTFSQIKKKNARIVPPHALNKIIAAIPDKQHEFRVFLMFMFHVGCSVKDAALMSPECIDYDKAIVQNVRNKTGVYYEVAIPRSLLDLLSELPKHPRYVFPVTAQKYKHSEASNLKSMFVYYKEAAGLQSYEFSLYDFRRGLVAQSIAEGQSVEDTARLLGHTGTTMLRNHYIPKCEMTDKLIDFRLAAKLLRNEQVNTTEFRGSGTNSIGSAYRPGDPSVDPSWLPDGPSYGT